MGKAAFVVFGEVNTPYEVLERKRLDALTELKKTGLALLDAGIVIDDERYETANAAIGRLKKEDFDAIILCVAGWIPTHAVIKVADPFKSVPMVLWGLCGFMENGVLVSTADQAGTTALRPAMQAMRYTFKYVYSIINKPHPVSGIAAYVKAAAAKKALRDMRIGTMGYRDMLLYGTMFNGALLRDVLGLEVEPFEMLEIARMNEDVAEADANGVVQKMKETYALTADADGDILIKSAKWAISICKLIDARGYGAITLNDVNGMKKLENLPPALTFMMIDRMRTVCTIPENDVMGSATQLICRCLTGQIAAYAEFYEFFEDSFLCGVPDFIPLEVTDGKPVLQPSAFGLLSTSVLNVSKYKTGLMTFARLAEYDGKLLMHLFTGDGRTPPAWQECGWAQPAPQLPSLQVFPHCGMDEFAGKVSSQHIIVTYGDHTSEIREFCSMLSIGLL